jgi:putative DNA primase/helicase
LPDGSLLLELVDESGAVAAAQTITPQGEKRLLTGSAKRGAYHAVNAPESPQSVLIAEGLATALSVHLMRPDALTVAAIDAGTCSRCRSDAPETPAGANYHRRR